MGLAQSAPPPPPKQNPRALERRSLTKKKAVMTEWECEHTALTLMTNFSRQEIAVLRNRFEKVRNQRQEDLDVELPEFAVRGGGCFTRIFMPPPPSPPKNRISNSSAEVMSPSHTAQSALAHGIINREEFLLALGQSKEDAPQFYHRIFDLFSPAGNEAVNFHQFVCALSNLHLTTPLEQKIKFVFKIFDSKNDDEIDLNEIRLIMTPLFEHAGLYLTEEQVTKLLMQTFSINDESEYLSYSKFFQMCQMCPQILRVFTLPLDLSGTEEEEEIPEPPEPTQASPKCWSPKSPPSANSSMERRASDNAFQ